MDSNYYVVNALERATKTAHDLERQVVGAAEGIEATAYSRAVMAEVRAAEQAAVKLRERLEKLAAKVERAYQRHEAEEERYALGAEAWDAETDTDDEEE